MQYPKRVIKKVGGCIRSTQWPQKPTNLLERILCDADLYHLAAPNFLRMSDALREERAKFGIEYSNEEWLTLNIDFFEKHHYWTCYGHEVLNARKQRNLQELLLKGG